MFLFGPPAVARNRITTLVQYSTESTGAHEPSMAPLALKWPSLLDKGAFCVLPPGETPKPEAVPDSVWKYLRSSHSFIQYSSGGRVAVKL